MPLSHFLALVPGDLLCQTSPGLLEINQAPSRTWSARQVGGYCSPLPVRRKVECKPVLKLHL